MSRTFKKNSKYHKRVSVYTKKLKKLYKRKSKSLPDNFDFSSFSL